MSLHDAWRRLVRKVVRDAPTEWTPADADRPVDPPVTPADVVAQPVKKSRVTRTMFGRCAGTWLIRANPEFGIRVRARCIPEAVEVIAANRGLTPREEQVA